MAPIDDQIAALDTTLFEHIESQTTERDRRSLLALQAACREQIGDFVYLEIGSHLGGSLQPYVLDPRCTRIISIDPRPASGPDARVGRIDYHANSTERMLWLLRQLPGADVDKVVTIEAGTDFLSPSEIEPAPALCFVDGEHTDAAALRDARFCAAAMDNEGCLVFHDAQVVHGGIRSFLSKLRDDAVAFDAYLLPNSIFVVELGEPRLRASEQVAAMLAESYHAYLWSLNALERRQKDTRAEPSGSLPRSGPAAGAQASVAGGEGPDESYDSAFFDRIRKGSRMSAEVVVPIVVDLVRPSTVVDVGCGRGTWLRVFQEAGVEDVVGVDGDYVREEQLEIPPERFVAADLESGVELGRRFDLAVSLEVAEHLPPAAGEHFVESLVRLAPVVLFSAAIPGQGGTGHLNEQWPEYWEAYFQRFGYATIDCVRPRVWKRARVRTWYAQNTLLYVDSTHLESRPALQAELEGTRPGQLSVVHPRFYTRRMELLRERAAKPPAPASPGPDGR